MQKKGFVLVAVAMLAIITLYVTLPRIDSVHTTSFGVIVNAAGMADDVTVTPSLSSEKQALTNVYAATGNPAIGNDDISGQVENKIKYARIVTPAMSRTEIQDVLNKGGIIRFLAGVYYLDYQNPNYPVCLDIQSNTTIICDKDVVIKCVPNNYTHYYVLNIDNKENVRIENGAVVGDRNEHIGTEGEWGFGVRIANSKNIYVRDVITQNCWGDGFYISGNSYNVTLENCIADNNRRQGCSITGGECIYINKGEYKNTNGTAPQAGIDIEPNSPTDKIKNIFVNNVSFDSNRGSGLEANIKGLVGKLGVPDEVTIFINNCVFNNNYRGLTYVCSSNTKQINNVKGLVRATNCIIKNSTNSLALYNIRDQLMPVFEAENIVIQGWKRYAIHTTTNMMGDGYFAEYGGFKLRNISLYDPPATFPYPAAAILFNPSAFKRINAVIDNLYIGDLPKWQAVYWTRGTGRVTYKNTTESHLMN